MPEALNPAQERVLRDLFDRGGARPAVDADLAPQLRAELQERIAGAVEMLQLAERQLFVNKHAITTVLGCEERWVRDTEFSWSTRTAVGSIAHKAAELVLVGKLVGSPSHAVDAAIEVACNDQPSGDFARFLQLASDGERAELRSRAITIVTSLTDAFPPIGPGWQARAEQLFRTAVGERTVTLSARPDLAFGRPVGPDARTLLIDFKAGLPAQTDLDDGRFYALVHTLVYGVAPWRVVTFYLAEATWMGEDIDADVLRAAVRRTSDAVEKMAATLCGGRVAALTPSPACRWCGIRAACPGSREWDDRLAAANDPEADLDRMAF